MLSLRPMTADDFDTYYAMRLDSENVRWSGWDNPPDKETFSQEIATDLANPTRAMLFAVSGGESVGYMKLVIDRGTADISYGIAEVFRRRGFGEQILRGVLEYIWESLPGVDRATARVVDKNESSAKCIKRAGFKNTGEKKPGPYEAVDLKNALMTTYEYRFSRPRLA